MTIIWTLLISEISQVIAFEKTYKVKGLKKRRIFPPVDSPRTFWLPSFRARAIR